MNVLEAIMSRRTIRKFTQQEIPAETLRTLVDAARMAAYGGNIQPLRYSVITGKELREKVFETTKWAGYLTDGAPKEGERPTAYIIVYSDENGYDVQTYIQLYNCANFLMQVEVESVARIIHDAKKPVMTIKPMAAGRLTPYVGLNFVYNTIRDCDMVTVGCFNELEMAEDIEIARAAIERRYPNMERRTSPNTQQAAFGK